MGREKRKKPKAQVKGMQSVSLEQLDAPSTPPSYCVMEENSSNNDEMHEVLVEIGVPKRCILETLKTSDGKIKSHRILMNKSVAEKIRKHAKKISETTGFKNRPLKKSAIRKYSKIMEAGDWDCNSSCRIIFDVLKNLVDGYHRVFCVDKTGCEIEIWIDFDEKEESHRYIDKGVSRNMSDTFNFVYQEEYNEYIPDSHLKALSPSINLYYRYSNGKMSLSSDSRPTEDEMINFLDKHRNMMNSVRKAYCCAAQREFIKSVGATCSAHYIFSLIDKDAADEFFKDLGVDGATNAKDPVTELRRKLVKADSEQQHYRQEVKLQWLIIAWNHRRNKKRLRNFPDYKSDNFPRAI